MTDVKLVNQMSDRLWRLHNLYYIINEYGKEVKFKPREGQLDFLNNMHNANIILKARQLGFSTLIQLLMLDAAVFNSNVNGAIIAQGLKEAKEIFRTKIRYPYLRLPEAITSRISLTTDSKDTLGLSNNSQISVGTSMRGATLTWLHISELAKICASDPAKSREIMTGALNAIQPGQAVFIESTAEGKEGAFYELATLAEKRQKQKVPLTPMDLKFHFHPWWKDPKYVLPPSGVIISTEMEEYFDKLEHQSGIRLSDSQKAWYVKKQEIQLDDMKREFPSTPAEAFEQAREGAYFIKQLLKAREEQRIGIIPHDPTIPVNTFWDIGLGDNASIWFHQKVGMQNRFINYYENSGEYFPHYVKILQEYNYVYGSHFLPHDAAHRKFVREGTVLHDAIKLLPGEVYLVPKVPNKQDSINAARNVFPRCWFDEKNCSLGIKRLENYRKEWNETLGIWRESPSKQGGHSDCADAFQCFAMSDINRGDEFNDDDEYFEDHFDERSSVSGY